MKKYLKYILWIVGFFILSEFLINVGLNSTYKTINGKNDIHQVNVYQSQATLVNGRIRGIITNSDTNYDISNKYLKIDLYSERDVLLGTKYIEIGTLDINETKAFEMFFKLENVTYYKMEIVDEAINTDDTPFFSEEFLQGKVIYLVIIAMLI